MTPGTSRLHVYMLPLNDAMRSPSGQLCIHVLTETWRGRITADIFLLV